MLIPGSLISTPRDTEWYQAIDYKNAEECDLIGVVESDFDELICIVVASINNSMLYSYNDCYLVGPVVGWVWADNSDRLGLINVVIEGESC